MVRLSNGFVTDSVLLAGKSANSKTVRSISFGCLESVLKNSRS